MADLCQLYPEVTESTPVLLSAAQEFLCKAAPDLTIARCKFILKESIFAVPRDGTFVMHPGICPEYRNAHGCFWNSSPQAPVLAQREMEKRRSPLV